MEYIVNRRAAAYLPARSVKRYLDSGKLHLVADAPRFPYPAWVIWREDLPADLAALARRTLTEVAEAAENEQETLTKGMDTIELFEPGHYKLFEGE